MKINELTPVQSIIVWGTGKDFKQYYNGQFKIDLLVDKDKSKQGTKLFGIEVQDPVRIKTIIDDNTIIVIATRAFFSEINETIKEMYGNIRTVTLKDFVYPYNNGFINDKYELLNKSCTTIESLGCLNVCDEFTDLVKLLKSQNKKITVAEIGIGFGVSGVTVCERLEKDDSYYYFDFDDVADGLEHDLKLIKTIKCKTKKISNSHRMNDSYCWGLSNLVYEMRKQNKNGLFDIVYLDGAHNFPMDGLATCLIKELVKPDGFIIFDDINWNMESSPTANPIINPAIRELYTDEQISECQVRRVVDMFMINDKFFESVNFWGNNGGREVFKKIK